MAPENGSRTDDLPKSYLQALDEEYWALKSGGVPSKGSEHERLLQAYESAQKAFGALDGNCSQADRDTAKAALEAAEQSFRHDLLTRLHEAKRSAICFSGGGIRSATFGLGVLQGLAAHSREDRDRPQLLGQFDYLSTVSGGGYLGSWFSAWAARKDPGPRVEQPGQQPGQQSRQPDNQVPVIGTASVIRQLAKNPDTKFDPEPSVVRHLRRYSNYLIPRLGLFSADTWAVVGTIVRNMFLNWVVLLPLVALLLLAPEAAFRAVQKTPPDWVLWAAVSLGFACGLLATGYMGFDLPSGGNARGNTARHLLFCLAPLVVSAVLLNTFWVWLHPDPRQAARWWDLVALGRNGIRAWQFALFGAVIQAGGLAAGMAAARIKFGRPPTRTGIIATLSGIITGALAGWLTYLLVTFVVPAAHIPDQRLGVCVAFPLVVGVFLVGAALLVGSTSYITEDKDREWWARSGGLFLSIALAWLVFAAIVIYSKQIVDWLHWTVTSAVGALAAWVTTRLGSSGDTSAGRREDVSATGKKVGLGGDWKQAAMGLAKEYAARLALPVFIVVLAVVIARANAWLLARLPEAPDKPLLPVLGLAVVYVLIGLGASLVINVNTFSLHAMYKLRLARAYLGASNPRRRDDSPCRQPSKTPDGCPHLFTGFDENDDVEMRSLSKDKPLHVVNMALNLVGGAELAWQQRKAESFTSTRLHTGGCRIGYRGSDDYAAGHRSFNRQPLTLGTVMTISGAAASPNMGYHSSPLLTIVMTLFNARLGWWLGNPKVQDYWRDPGPRFGIRAFIDEAFGLTDDTNRWVYLSDGGHFDNLGLYEMLLRRCHLIVVCDGGADPKFAFEDLGNAVRKARVDLGVSIEFDGPMPSGFANGGNGVSGPHCAIGRIRYAADPIHPPDGTLIYIKASLTGDEPPDVRHYHAQNPLFPHETTTDQFFDEAQFESYRRLGLHIIEMICDRTAPSPPDKKLDLAEFAKHAEDYCAAFGGQHRGTALIQANWSRLESWLQHLLAPQSTETPPVRDVERDTP